MLHTEILDFAVQATCDPLAVTVGKRIAVHLADGCHLTRAAICEFFAEATGAESRGSAWTIDDYNDAVETGSILWLRQHSRIDLDTAVDEAAARFDWLDAALPPRHVRSETQVALQQFSTPPMLAWLMAGAAHLRHCDTVLEPSAGNGALAHWADTQGTALVLNDVDHGRVQALACLFPRATVSACDGEVIDHLLARTSPTVVLMNPPFARSAERGTNSATAMRHLRSACRLLTHGGRLVAIVPEGFDAKRFVDHEGALALRFEARMSGAFRKSGTGIPVRLVIIDRTSGTGKAMQTDLSDLRELARVLTDLPPRPRVSPTDHRLGFKTPAGCPDGRCSAKLVAPFGAQSDRGDAYEPLVFACVREPIPVPDQAGLYLPYRPSRIVIEGAPPHPTPLVESVAMGSVAAPLPRARPNLPRGWRTRKLLSEAQCETLIYACDAFSHDLSGRFRPSQEGTRLEQAADGSRYRQGFFLGDGTGAGKGRQIAALFMDRWLIGERRHIWITRNEALLQDARRDWEALGGLPLDIQPLSRWKPGSPIGFPQGILFATYPTLRSGGTEDTRLDQILAWAGRWLRRCDRIRRGARDGQCRWQKRLPRSDQGIGAGDGRPQVAKPAPESARPICFGNRRFRYRQPRIREETRSVGTGDGLCVA